MGAMKSGWFRERSGYVFISVTSIKARRHIDLTCCSLLPHGVPWAPWYSHFPLRGPRSTAADEIRSRAGCLRTFRDIGVS